MPLNNNNDNEQTLVLEPNESDAPGAEEPVGDGSAPDGPVGFTREIPRRSERLRN